jgi:hypothetical protein
MTTEQDMTMVFKDATGEYYLLPLETLKQGRVPAEQKAEVERLITEPAEVQGYALPALLGLYYVGGAMLGFAVGYYVGSSPTPTAPPNPDIPVTEEPGRPA